MGECVCVAEPLPVLLLFFPPRKEACLHPSQGSLLSVSELPQASELAIALLGLMLSKTLLQEVLGDQRWEVSM